MTMYQYKIKLSKLVFLFLAIYASLSFAQESTNKTSSKTEYKYKLIVKVDFKKREKILKANGEDPTIYDKTLSFVKGDFHAGNVIDIVEKDASKLKVVSVISPVTMIGYVIGDKTLRRESLSEATKNGFLSISYSEKRGDASKTTSRNDYKIMKSSFYDGVKLENSEKINQDVYDMLSVVYEGVGKKKTTSFLVNNSKSNKLMIFDPAEVSDISIDGKKYKAKRYFKKVTANDNANFEIWIDEQTKIPLRYQIGLSDKYGATLLFELSSQRSLN